MEKMEKKFLTLKTQNTWQEQKVNVFTSVKLTATTTIDAAKAS